MFHYIFTINVHYCNSYSHLCGEKYALTVLIFTILVTINFSLLLHFYYWLWPIMLHCFLHCNNPNQWTKLHEFQKRKILYTNFKKNFTTSSLKVSIIFSECRRSKTSDPLILSFMYIQWDYRCQCDSAWSSLLIEYPIKYLFILILMLELLCHVADHVCFWSLQTLINK